MIDADYDSPIGRLALAADARGLRRLHFGPSDRSGDPAEGRREAARILDEARRQLDAYFAGALRRFTVPLAPTGTPFQQEVWRALTAIPYGETITYGEQARRVGRPSAARAVGAANGRNPISIVIPCHRVVGANGSLTGFAWGLERKAWLLGLESGAEASVGAAG
ncbi:MAG: methylated-DNA--[protein]-cysteine S-methyltransferase [Myxococcales bacterium]|nr:methylated-DNA--[protein]-cysteine S-methyltransferase [Myxococcales bacterium]